MALVSEIKGPTSKITITIDPNCQNKGWIQIDWYQEKINAFFEMFRYDFVVINSKNDFEIIFISKLNSQEIMIIETFFKTYIEISEIPILIQIKIE